MTSDMPHSTVDLFKRYRSCINAVHHYSVSQFDKSQSSIHFIGLQLFFLFVLLLVSISVGFQTFWLIANFVRPFKETNKIRSNFFVFFLCLGGKWFEVYFVCAYFHLYDIPQNCLLSFQIVCFHPPSRKTCIRERKRDDFAYVFT